MSEYKGNDFYCDVALGDREHLTIIYEDDHILAFNHTRPFWQPVHIVVTTKEHILSFTDYDSQQQPLVEQLFQIVRKIARDVERDYGAARIITNLGEYQDSKHFHIHVVYGESRK